jgi:hypothetical protein
MARQKMPQNAENPKAEQPFVPDGDKVVTARACAVSEIIIPDDARIHDDASVREMAASMEELGLLQSVLVTPDNRLVDGKLRLGAARLLGWDEIDVHVVDLDELRIELAGIDANLIRIELTKLELAECLLRRQAIYEILHPETKYGSSEMMQDVRRGDIVSPRQPGFAADAADKMGCDPRTVQRLVKIAKALPKDVRYLLRDTPTADMQGDLEKLSRCPEGEQRKIAGQLATGELTRVPKDAGRAPSWTPPDPDAVLRQAIRILTAKTSGRPDADVDAIPNAVREIEMARSVWDTPAATDDVDLPPNLSLDEIDQLPAGQLGAWWLSQHVVQIVKSDTPISHVAVRRAARSDNSFIKPRGNTKTQDWMGILSSCSHGCCRRAVGLPGTERSCYSADDGSGGCYVDAFACKKRAEFADSQVIENGLTNSILRITLPEDGNSCLDDRIPADRVGDIMAWRVDCESSTGDLSISLGLLQQWCESNPAHRVATICANHFCPSDAMMAWLAALDNVVVGHSVSAWFSPQELASRFAAIERFLEWGIPTQIWIVTDPDWASEPVLARALELVGPEHIIEEPHRLSASRQQPPVLHVNPAGPCSSKRIDAEEQELVFVPGEDGQPGEYLVPLPDGGDDKPKGTVHARCRGCQVRCGLTAHGMMERRSAVDTTDVVDLRPIVHTPFPPATRQNWDVLLGDARKLVRSLDQVHCVVTSPPYFNLKAYGPDPLEVGRENDDQEYIETLCEIFGAIPLHPLGSLWVNLRDKRQNRALRCIPERFIIAMQDRGWKLLDRVVWAKSALNPDGTTQGGCMTEDNPWRLNGNGWEYLLRFSRTKNPWFDPCATLIPRVNGDGERYLPPDRMILPTELDGRIPPDVWLFGPDRSGAAHVAPWPEILCEIPIALSCPLWVNPDGSLPQRLVEKVEYDDGHGPRKMGKYTQPDLLMDGGPQRHDTGRIYVPRKPQSLGWTEIVDGAEPGVVCDPFMGIGTTGVVALKLGRRFVGIDLDDGFCESAREKLELTLSQLERDEWVAEPLVANA